MTSPELDGARETLLAQLREHALVIGDVTLSSGQQASYYVDARRALLRPEGFLAAGRLIAAAARDAGAEAVGGPVMAAIPLAHGEALAAEIPDAELLVLDGVGHEHPRRAWDRIVPAILERTAG